MANRTDLLNLIGKECSISVDHSTPNEDFRKLHDVGVKNLIFESKPKPGGDTEKIIVPIKDIREIRYREIKTMRGPFGVVD